MDDEEALEALGKATSAMAAAVAAMGEADHRAAVPACRGWDVEDLVDHLGRVHLWAAHCARFGQEPERYPRRDRARPIAAWYAEVAGELVTTLAELAPDRPAWSFSDEPGTQRAGFWRRRQFHETTVHRVDALQAVGVLASTGPIASVPGLTTAEAADGVDEVLRVMVPRTLVRRAGEPPLHVVPAPAPVGLHAEDAGRSWTLRISGGRALVADGVASDARACLRGRAGELYLALWHRADASGITVDGDLDAGRRLLDATLVP